MSLRPSEDAVFELLLLESIDEATSGTLGNSPLRAIFDVLENNFHIKRTEIPNRIPSFCSVSTERLRSEVVRAPLSLAPLASGVDRSRSGFRFFVPRAARALHTT